MKNIVIVSGKGGTGKSTIAACLAQIVPDKMIADCDVDAANLHLILDHEVLQVSDYEGASIAEIDADRCVACGSADRSAVFQPSHLTISFCH